MNRDSNSGQDTPPTIRRSALNTERGPIYTKLARDLSERLFALRLAKPGEAHSIGELAREAGAMADTFEHWLPATTEAKKASDVMEWQEIKKRARAFGCEVL